MSHFTNTDALDEVLNVLKKTTDNFPSAINDLPEEPVKITEEDIDSESEYKKLLVKIGNSLSNNNKVLEEAAEIVRLVGDHHTLEAYASVAKSNSEMLKTLSSAITERDRIRTQEKLKEKDLALKKELAELKNSSENPKIGGTTNIQNNFVLKSSRDEMFDMIFGKPEEKEKAAKKIFGENAPVPVLEAEYAKE